MQAASLVFPPHSLAVFLVLQTLLFYMVNDGTSLNSNGSSPSEQSSMLPLRLLQEIIDNRIIQKKSEMHPSHNKVYLESLRIEVDHCNGYQHKYLFAATLTSHIKRISLSNIF
ncbi:MAG: hypothetical protein M3250_04975 [Thermoproteota archaeon]|nr:hypothetical protein [Thermoproteota archaeon]